MPTERELDANSQLMKDCGAPAPYTWQPLPTDHIAYQMHQGDAISRAVGYVQWYTIRGVVRKGKICRTRWATGEDGKLITIPRAAVDLGWKPQTTLNNFLTAESEGLITLDRSIKPWRIGLCASVHTAERKKRKPNNSVRRYLPPKLLERIDSFSVIQQHQFWDAYGKFQQWRKDLESDVMEQSRTHSRQVEDSILFSFQLERARESKSRERKTPVEVALFEFPDFVHTVQSEDCTKPEPPTVQSETEALNIGSRVETPSAAPDPPPPSLIPWMRNALKAYPGARQLPGEPDDKICRKCLTAGTPADIAAGLQAMHKAGKAPSKSWAWFTPDIIRQHVPERKTA